MDRGMHCACPNAQSCIPWHILCTHLEHPFLVYIDQATPMVNKEKSCLILLYTADALLSVTLFFTTVVFWKQFYLSS